ncbi:Sulfotransferase 4A1 [Chelonia mydas]|uniref:Sulfotransferase n=1 Tax=Chelonia mydas TaxID=8469 RepID=M7BEI8_CHEMY|nr:Sulfotransferase 4A1 [Chelonia mydas]
MAESEAETPSTPGEFESKYFEYNGVRLPPFCRGKMEEIANFPELTSPRLIKSHLPYRFLPSDLHNGDSKVIYMARNPKDLVVSYYQFHRSLRTMSYRGTFQEFCRRFMNDKLGYGSWFEHVQEFWEHHTDSNVLFLKYEDMHKDLATMVEQLVRFLGVSYDKAQLESMVEHCHQLIDQCCNAEALPVGRVGYGSWFEHVQEFWEHHTDSNVLFLKYEDMHKDLATMVEQLVRFLGVSYDKAQLESMVEHCHQLIDQCCNAEALPVGRGRVGLWKDIFTVSMNEKFDLVYKQKMGKCDLTFDFYL